MQCIEFLQIPFVVTQDLNVIENSKKLILPGVGHIKNLQIILKN